MLGRVNVSDPRAIARRAAFRGAPRGVPQLRIDVDGAVITGSRIPVLSLVQRGGEVRAPDLASLGPDLLAKDFGEPEEAEAIRRLREESAREIGDAIMQQRAVAGIGNVYKSGGAVHREGGPARTGQKDLDDETLRAAILLARAKAPARERRERAPRTPRDAQHDRRAALRVYLRAGKRCFLMQERDRDDASGRAAGPLHVLLRHVPAITSDRGSAVNSRAIRFAREPIARHFLRLPTLAIEKALCHARALRLEFLGRARSAFPSGSSRSGQSSRRRPGTTWTFFPAAHRYEKLCVARERLRQLLRFVLRQIDSDFAHRSDHDRMNALARLSAGGNRARLFLSSASALNQAAAIWQIDPRCEYRQK